MGCLSGHQCKVEQPPFVGRFLDNRGVVARVVVIDNTSDNCRERVVIVIVATSRFILDRVPTNRASVDYRRSTGNAGSCDKGALSFGGRAFPASFLTFSHSMGQHEEYELP